MSGTTAVLSNRSYGAFELKRLYPKYYTLGLAAAVTFHLLVLVIYLLSGPRGTVVKNSIVNHVNRIDIKRFEAPTILPLIQNAGAQISSVVKQDGTPLPVADNKAEPGATIKSTEERRDNNPLRELSNGGDALELNNATAVIPPTVILPGPNDFVPVEKMPELVIAPKPVYPEIAIKAGIVGKVHVKALVSKEGKVLTAFVVKSDSELLNQAALDAAMKWVFTPALQNNHPVAVWIVLMYNFNLQDQ